MGQLIPMPWPLRVTIKDALGLGLGASARVANRCGPKWHLPMDRWDTKALRGRTTQQQRVQFRIRDVCVACGTLPADRENSMTMPP